MSKSNVAASFNNVVHSGKAEAAKAMAELSNETKAREGISGPQSKSNSRKRQKNSHRTTNQQLLPVSIPATWSKPREVFNVRIPTELNSILDDLIYKRKKAGRSHTKTELAGEALTLLVKREGLLVD